jgi:hypothetical protein
MPLRDGVDQIVGSESEALGIGGSLVAGIAMERQRVAITIMLSPCGKFPKCLSKGSRSDQGSAHDLELSSKI